MTGMFDPASPQAQAISELFIVVLLVCAVIFLVVGSIVTYAIVRALRERARGQEAPDAVENEKPWLEVFWTAIPLAICIGIFLLSVGAARDSDPAPTGAPDVIVRGHQWWWEIEYPEAGVITANELHIPVGKKVHLQIESADVIHDFWIPALARKIDAVPGHENHILFEANRAGTYDGVCAEYCGAQHGWMRMEAVVHPPDEFEAWLGAQALPAGPPQAEEARAGLALYMRETCDRCHSLRGVPSDAAPIQIGPDLTHFASRRLLGSGVLENNLANVTAWLKDPQTIKEGCHMPNFQFSDQQVAELAAYLMGLE